MAIKFTLTRDNDTFRYKLRQRVRFPMSAAALTNRCDVIEPNGEKKEANDQQTHTCQIDFDAMRVAYAKCNCSLRQLLSTRRIPDAPFPHPVQFSIKHKLVDWNRKMIKQIKSLAVARSLSNFVATVFGEQQQLTFTSMPADWSSFCRSFSIPFGWLPKSQRPAPCF